MSCLRLLSHQDKAKFKDGRIILEDEFDDELFALYKKKTERTMKIAVAFFAVIFLFVLYFLIYG